MQAVRLRAAVADLTAGDNLVSLVFAIEEPGELIPAEFADSYPDRVDRWVFGHFGDLLNDSEAVWTSGNTGARLNSSNP